METKDIITLGFSSLSLILSLATFYLTQLRPPKLEAALGPMAHLFYAKEGPLIILPTVIFNNSPTKTIVRRVMLELRDTRGEYFSMNWLQSVEIDLENKYVDKGRAAPFKLDGFEASSNALKFHYPRLDGHTELDWLEGDYVFSLHLWTSAADSPDLTFSEVLIIPAEIAQKLKLRKARKDGSSWYLPFAGKALISVHTGQMPADYSKLTHN